MMLSDLRGENALVIVGTVSRLLKKIEQHFPDSPEYKGLYKRYREEAMSGDYIHLCAVTEKYVIKYLPNTLRAELGDLTEEYEDA